MRKWFKIGIPALVVTLALVVGFNTLARAAHGRFFELMSTPFYINEFGATVKTSKQGSPGYGGLNSCRISSLVQYRMSDPDGFERRGINAVVHDPLRTYDMRVTQARAECKVRIEGPDQGKPDTNDTLFLITGISYGGQVYEEFASENPTIDGCQFDTFCPDLSTSEAFTPENLDNSHPNRAATPFGDYQPNSVGLWRSWAVLIYHTAWDNGYRCTNGPSPDFGYTSLEEAQEKCRREHVMCVDTGLNYAGEDETQEEGFVTLISNPMAIIRQGATEWDQSWARSSWQLDISEHTDLNNGRIVVTVENTPIFGAPTTFGLGHGRVPGSSAWDMTLDSGTTVLSIGGNLLEYRGSGNKSWQNGLIGEFSFGSNDHFDEARLGFTRQYRITKIEWEEQGTFDLVRLWTGE